MSQVCIVMRAWEREWEGGGCESLLTHVMSKDTKKRSATLVYPNAARFISIAARLVRSATVECALGAKGGGVSVFGLSGSESMVTEYWS